MNVLGSALEPFVDAIRLVLLADSDTTDARALGSLIGSRVYGGVSRTSRAQLPYLVLGTNSAPPEMGAMQREMERTTLQIDVWSDKNGPHEARAVLSRVRALLLRRDVSVSGFELVRGSLVCEMSDVFEEFDADMPETTRFHGVQRWSALVESV